jgi:uncharacterized membrane protein
MAHQPVKVLFPGASQRDDWDFLFVATSIGATSETSDVGVRSRTIRQLLTRHAVISFVRNTAVLAPMINLAASVIG